MKLTLMTGIRRGADITLKRVKLRNICAVELLDITDLSVDLILAVLNMQITS